MLVCKFIATLIVHCSLVFSSVDFLQEPWDEGNCCMENAHVHIVCLIKDVVNTETTPLQDFCKSSDLLLGVAIIC